LTYDVAVIGLGAHGAAALWRLAQAGVRAIGFERHAIGHDRGSSHGESRAIRLAYAEHPSYVPLVRAAYEGWKALDAEAGTSVLHETGVLEAGPEGCATLAGVLASARAHSLAHETLTAREAGRRFPAFALPEGTAAVWQAEGGFIEPEHAIRAMAARAEALGATVRADCAVQVIECLPSVIRLRTDAGVVEAGRVIVAAGAWAADFAPDWRRHLSWTKQVLGWFSPSRPALCGAGSLPVFLIETEDDFVYGFPDFAGTGVKAASHRLGPVLHEPVAGEAWAEELAPVGRALARLVPGAAGPLVRQVACLYTNTPDGDFLIAPSPEDRRVVLCQACSGHGFKFAPAIGEALAGLATTGVSPHDLSRFSPSRFG
jgi:sarcosine oxidase